MLNKMYRAHFFWSYMMGDPASTDKASLVPKPLPPKEFSYCVAWERGYDKARSFQQCFVLVKDLRFSK